MTLVILSINWECSTGVTCNCPDSHLICTNTLMHVRNNLYFPGRTLNFHRCTWSQYAILFQYIYFYGNIVVFIVLVGCVSGLSLKTAFDMNSHPEDFNSIPSAYGSPRTKLPCEVKTWIDYFSHISHCRKRTSLMYSARSYMILLILLFQYCLP